MGQEINEPRAARTKRAAEQRRACASALAGLPEPIDQAGELTRARSEKLRNGGYIHNGKFATSADRIPR